MPEPRWMSVVIDQRRRGGWAGGDERLPYAAVDAEPLPNESEHDIKSLGRRLAARLRSAVRTPGSAEGALR